MALRVCRYYTRAVANSVGCDVYQLNRTISTFIHQLTLSMCTWWQLTLVAHVMVSLLKGALMKARAAAAADAAKQSQLLSPTPQSVDATSQRADTKSSCCRRRSSTWTCHNTACWIMTWLTISTGCLPVGSSALARLSLSLIFVTAVLIASGQFSRLNWHKSICFVSV